MKIVLAGNPNAGKTTLFNALTKSKLKTGNWHGVTTRPASKTYGGVTYVDVPGMYSFNPYSMEEDCAAKEIKSADVVINVADGLTLKNSLALTRTILSMNKRTVIYVTKLKQLKRRGGRLDAAELSRLLGVPVVCDIKELKRILKDPSAIQKASLASSNSKSRLDAAYYGGNCTLTRAEKLFYNRYFALAFFIVAVLFMFFTAFFPGMPGDALKGLTEELISVKLGGAVKSVLPEGKSAFLYSAAYRALSVSHPSRRKRGNVCTVVRYGRSISKGKTFGQGGVFAYIWFRLYGGGNTHNARIHFAFHPEARHSRARIHTLRRKNACVFNFAFAAVQKSFSRYQRAVFCGGGNSNDSLPPQRQRG